MNTVFGSGSYNIRPQIVAAPQPRIIVIRSALRYELWLVSEYTNASVDKTHMKQKLGKGLKGVVLSQEITILREVNDSIKG